jgi:methionyl-tRNA formyltransferase
MTRKRIVIASTHTRNAALTNELGKYFDILYIKDINELNFDLIKEFNPQYIFFPHWSLKIPDEIHLHYECIIFHMTDLPFGRGGSPLQNLIARGYEETKLSAIRCVSEIDAGPIYLKKPLSLLGSAEEILLRANNLIKEMILEIAIKQPIPIKQTGKAIVFKRRKSSESNIESENIQSLGQLFNHIRMLDAEGYPFAFLETNEFKFEFSRASLKLDCLIADVKITRKLK